MVASGRKKPPAVASMDMLADAALGSRPVADLPKHLPNERPPLLTQQSPDFTAALLTDDQKQAFREVVVLWEQKLTSNEGRTPKQQLQDKIKEFDARCPIGQNIEPLKQKVLVLALRWVLAKWEESDAEPKEDVEVLFTPGSPYSCSRPVYATVGTPSPGRSTHRVTVLEEEFPCDPEARQRYFDAAPSPPTSPLNGDDDEPDPRPQPITPGTELRMFSTDVVEGQFKRQCIERAQPYDPAASHAARNGAQVGRAATAPGGGRAAAGGGRAAAGRGRGAAAATVPGGGRAAAGRGGGERGRGAAAATVGGGGGAAAGRGGGAAAGRGGGAAAGAAGGQQDRTTILYQFTPTRNSKPAQDHSRGVLAQLLRLTADSHPDQSMQGQLRRTLAAMLCAPGHSVEVLCVSVVCKHRTLLPITVLGTADDSETSGAWAPIQAAAAAGCNKTLLHLVLAATPSPRTPAEEARLAQGCCVLLPPSAAPPPPARAPRDAPPRASVGQGTSGRGSRTGHQGGGLSQSEAPALAHGSRMLARAALTNTAWKLQASKSVASTSLRLTDCLTGWV